MSLLDNKPSASDPYGDAKQKLGDELVERVFNEMTVADCIDLALRKAHATDTTRTHSLMITKLEEAQHWLWAGNRPKPPRTNHVTGKAIHDD